MVTKKAILRLKNNNFLFSLHNYQVFYWQQVF